MDTYQMFSCVLVIGFQSEPCSLKSGLGRANTSGTLSTLSLATKVSPLRTLLAGSFGMFVVLGPGLCYYAMSICIVCVQICWCSCYERNHELTSLMDPCLEGGGPSFSSRCILPQTMKITMVVTTSRIRKNKMPITRPAIAPPLKPVGRGSVNHVTVM